MPSTPGVTEGLPNTGRRGGRRLLGGLLVTVLTTGAGVGVGATTRPSSSLSTAASSTPSTGVTAARTDVSPLDVAAIAARVSPAIVDINTTLSNQPAAAAGTGMALSASGVILTNNHVIADAATIKVRSVASGKTYAADVLGYDVPHDIAVLQLRDASGLATITPAKQTALIGDQIVAIGNALGKGGTPDAKGGVVSGTDQTLTASDNGAKSETLNGMIQVNAQIQPGDSGGPLVNPSGEVLGMDTAASTSGSQLDQLSSGTVGFAIPIARALSIADRIRSGEGGGSIHLGTRAFLGVELGSDTSGSRGAAVVGVIAGSPADSLGIARGDEIISVDGKTITTSTELGTDLAARSPGDKVTVGWVDMDGQSHTATVALSAGPPL